MSLGLGIFNDMGVKQTWDHIDIIGLSTDPIKYVLSDFIRFYRDLLKTLAELPVITPVTVTGPGFEAIVSSVPVDVPVDESVPDSFNITELSCGPAMEIARGMCMNTSSSVEGFTFSSTDCEVIAIDAVECEQMLAAASAAVRFWTLSWAMPVVPFLLWSIS